MTVGNADPQALLAAFDKVDPARPRECPWLTPLLTILRELGPRAKPAAPALTKLLKQNLKDEELARAAMAALVKTESPDTKAVLLYVAEHGEGMLPEAALAAFARTDPSAAEDLVQLIEAGPSDVRRAAISGLRFTGRAAAPALLTRLEKGKPLRVRYDAINALTELQGQAKQAFPALAAVAKDSDEDAGLRIQATRALAAVDPAAAAGVYIELHKGRSRPRRPTGRSATRPCSACASWGARRPPR